MSDATQIAIAIVYDSAGRLLIGQRQGHQVLAGMWEFPGGKLQPGETAAAAAQRECREETGLDVDVLDRIHRQLQQYHHGKVDLHFFRCSTSDIREPTPPFRWIPRSELHRYEFPAGNQQVLQLL